MSIDKNVNPRGVGSSYGQRRTLSRFDANKRYENRLYSDQFGNIFNGSGEGVVKNRFAKASGVPLTDVGSGWGAAGTGTITQDSTGVLLAKNGVGGFILARKYGQTINLRADSVITIEATLSGVATASIFRIELSSDGFSAKSALLEHVVKNAHGNKLVMSFPASGAALNGGELITNTMNYIGVSLADSSATASAKITKIQVNTFDRPALIIDFDDGFTSQYTEVFRAMSSVGLVGNIAVIGSEVGKNGQASKSQLQEMYDSGWDLMTHGFDTHNTLATESRIFSDVASNFRYLADNGFDRAADHYVFPGGIVNANSLAALRRVGMVTGRLVDDNITPTHQGFSGDEMFGLWSYDISQNRGTASLLAAVDKAIATGTSVRMHGHRVVNSVVDVGNEMTVSDFATLVEGLRTRVATGKIDNLTISDWWNRYGK